MELCKKKNDDGVWMDELAAMQACHPSEFSYMGTSGIILASENNDSSQNAMLNFHNSDLPSDKQNGLVDASVSDSTLSHGSIDNNPGVAQSMVDSPLVFSPTINFVRTCNLFFHPY